MSSSHLARPWLAFLLPSLAAAHPQIDPTPRALFPNLYPVSIDLDRDGRSELLRSVDGGVLQAYHCDDQGRLVGGMTLSPPVPESSGTPLGLVDVDGDAIDDLVGFRNLPVGGTNWREWILWKGLGGMEFEAAVGIAPWNRSDSSTTIVANDLDGDGDLDILVYPYRSFVGLGLGGGGGDIQVIRNLGGGAFDPPVSLLASSDDFYTARPLDLDQDGDLDFMAILADTGELVILRQTAGTLQIEALPVAPPISAWLDVADIDHDGVLDLVTRTVATLAPPLQSEFDLYFGLASGSFLPPVRVAGYSGEDLDSAMLADVNGDGATDIVVSPAAAGPSGLFGVEVLAGSGTGQFAPPVRSSESPYRLASLMGGDFNGDGRADIVSRDILQMGGTYSGRPSIRLSSVGAPVSDVSFEAPEPTYRDGFQGPLLVGDLNSDGLQDVVARLDTLDGFSPPEIVWIRGVAGAKELMFEGLVGLRGEPVVVADFNGSGVAGSAILVRGTNLGPDLYLVRVTSSGQFLPPLSIGPNPFGTSPITALDWDQDGDLDLLGIVSGSLLWMEQVSSETFAPAATLIQFSQSLVVPESYEFGDFNGDSIPDVAIDATNLVNLAKVLSWRPGLGGGALGSEIVTAAQPYGTLVVDDFDGDGSDDVAWTVGNPDRIEWLPGGSAGLDPGPARLLVATVREVGHFTRVDFDGDLDLDLVVLEENSRDIVGYMNLGGGAYDASPMVLAEDATAGFSAGALTLQAVDFGGDRDLDLLTGLGPWYENLFAGVRGDFYCSVAAPNSTGDPGEILALGSTSVAAGLLRLRAQRLPSLSFGYFLTSQTASAPMAAANSSGFLCLGGAIGRYSAPSQIRFSGAQGQFVLDLDLSQMPTPTGLVQALPGSTWNFQAWFRDAAPAGPTSNFTNAVAVSFE